MNEWKKMIIEGNQAFNSGLFYSAERYYKVACDFASEMNPIESSHSNLIASLVVSYQNLAELYFNQNQYDLALSQYQELHEKLLMFGAKYEDSPKLLAAIRQATCKIGTELLDITKRLGIQSLRSRQVIAAITKTPPLQLH